MAGTKSTAKSAAPSPSPSTTAHSAPANSPAAQSAATLPPHDHIAATDEVVIDPDAPWWAKVLSSKDFAYITFITFWMALQTGLCSAVWFWC
ncbi:hypothetical protein M8J76_008342 [Diaphorina citri]|nr:hypothetical protein M8J76_008342 [Diaphorina citri]